MGNKTTRQHKRVNKRQQFAAGSNSNKPIIVVLLSTVAFLVLVGYLAIARSPKPTGAGFSDALLLPSGTDVRLPVSAFSDGRAHHYRYKTSVGREVRVFVIRSSDGVIRAAFDACDVCYRERKGYHQDGDDLVCNNCGRHFRSADVNVVTGGCNPSALPRTIEDGQIVLKAQDLDLGAVYF